MLLVYIHLFTVLPAALLGAWLLARKKGTSVHKTLGRAYVALMMLSSAVSLFLPANVGPRVLGHFGVIHLLSLLVLCALPVAVIAARQRRLARHRRTMILVFVGGIAIAGTLTLVPGRLLHQWLIAWWW